jgi:DNA-binding MarR family transcriptional regulator
MAHVPDLRLGARMNGQTADVPDEAADPYVESLLRASRALMSITARSLASVNEEVTLPQFRSLVVLSTAGPQTVSALADRLAVHASTMTRMCNRLVTRGLVVRVPSAVDRREVVIALTDMGTSVVENVMAARRRELDAVVQRMGADDRAAAITALNHFVEAAGEGLPVDPQFSTARAVNHLEE